MAIQIEVLPGDLFTLFVYFFTATNEGKGKDVIFNRLFFQLDKQVRQVYGLQQYNIHVDNLRKEIAKTKKAKS